MHSRLMVSLITMFVCGAVTGHPLGAMAQLPSKEPLTPLMKASAKADLPEVLHLLGTGVDARQRTTDGETALYEAIEWRHPEADNLPIVEALVRAGADPNETEIFGLSALEVSLTRDHMNPEVTLLLLRAGARVPSDCPKSGSLISLATQDSSLEVISALIARRAPVNCQSEHGQTALHWAALNGQADRVALLLKSGADVRLRNSEGKTPLDVAKTTNPDKRVQALFASTRAELIDAVTSTSVH
jgi:ankyrin repeat protein